ncbi:hypothetical protein A5689_27090 [Mycobacterium intracellulare subsp. yongonense]|nr:hypothetical protein A5689_27090 [Mycobacterium intracellulare subsp. yongonense]
MGVRATLWLMAAGALIGYAVMGSIRAHAEPAAALTAAEKQFADMGGGRGVCDIFDTYGLTAKTAVGAVQAVAKVGGFPLVDSAQIVNYSVATYCPRWWNTLAEIGSEARAQAPAAAGTVI